MTSSIFRPPSTPPGPLISSAAILAPRTMNWPAAASPGGDSGVSTPILTGPWARAGIATRSAAAAASRHGTRDLRVMGVLHVKGIGSIRAAWYEVSPMASRSVSGCAVHLRTRQMSSVGQQRAHSSSHTWRDSAGGAERLPAAALVKPHVPGTGRSIRNTGGRTRRSHRWTTRAGADRSSRGRAGRPPGRHCPKPHSVRIVESGFMKIRRPPGRRTRTASGTDARIAQMPGAVFGEREVEKLASGSGTASALPWSSGTRCRVLALELSCGFELARGVVNAVTRAPRRMSHADPVRGPQPAR